MSEQQSGQANRQGGGPGGRSGGGQALFSRLADVGAQRAGVIGSIAGAVLLVAVVLGYILLSGDDAMDAMDKEVATSPGSDTGGDTGTGSESTGSESADSDAEASEDEAAASLSTSADADAAPTDPGIPQFLLARVDPQGSLVLSGTAPPNSRVTILDGETALGDVQADARGEWVFVPDAPLPVGERVISLMSEDADAVRAQSDMALIVVIPEPGKDITGTLIPGGGTGDRTPLVMLMPRDPSAKTASQVLQAPGGVAAVQKDTTVPQVLRDLKARQGVSVGVIDYNDKGEIIFAGTARPDSKVRVYIDNQPAGDAGVNAAGQWSFTPGTLPSGETITPGTHMVRIDGLDGDDKVYARAEAPFMRAAPFRDLPGNQVVVIQPGATLWRIATRIYGDGVRYADIYKANAEQIRDPDLIYPGQVFGIPPAAKTTE